MTEPGRYVHLARVALAHRIEISLTPAAAPHARLQIAGENVCLVPTAQEGTRAGGAWITPEEHMLLSLLPPAARLQFVEAITSRRGKGNGEGE